MRKGINKLTQKHANRGLVFQLLAVGDADSRIALARRTRLSKMALSNIISEFLERDLVREPEDTVRGTRSNPIVLSLSPNAPKILGIMIQRRDCRASVCDFSMRILDSEQRHLPDPFDGDLLTRTLFDITDRLLARHPDILGIGIGSIGPVDIHRGVILNPPDFQGITDLPIRRLFEQRYPLPVALEHHYNCAALTESLYGSGRGFENLLYVGLSSGIGMGVISGGRLSSDNTGLASEFGHVSVNFDGPVCRCGNRGCLEAYASVDAIVREAAALPQVPPDTDFAGLCRFSHVPEVDRLLTQRILRPLSSALCSAVNLLNPDLILLGDEAAALPDDYYRRLEQALSGMILSRDYHRVIVGRPAFSAEFNAAMCAISIIQQVFQGDLAV